jgi:hypothetical protein
MRHCIGDNHLGYIQQVLVAIDNLGPRQLGKFHRAFPEYQAAMILLKHWKTCTGRNATMYDLLAGYVMVEISQDNIPALDWEYSSWIADWIEQNTQMYWENGELWINERRR